MKDQNLNFDSFGLVRTKQLASYNKESRNKATLNVKLKKSKMSMLEWLPEPEKCHFLDVSMEPKYFDILLGIRSYL